MIVAKPVQHNNSAALIRSFQRNGVTPEVMAISKREQLEFPPLTVSIHLEIREYCSRHVNGIDESGTI